MFTITWTHEVTHRTCQFCTHSEAEAKNAIHFLTSYTIEMVDSI